MAAEGFAHARWAVPVARLGTAPGLLYKVCTLTTEGTRTRVGKRLEGRMNTSLLRLGAMHPYQSGVAPVPNGDLGTPK
jgi:hypothetical protein